MKNYLFILLIGWLSTSFAFGQKFTASISKKSVKVGEEFTITYSAEGGNLSGTPVANLDFSKNGLVLTSGPNLTSEFSFFNGKSLQKSAVSYILMAEKPGKYTIPGQLATIGRKKIRCGAIRFNVSGKAINQSAQAGTGNNAAANAQTPTATQFGKDVFVELSTDKDTIYLGEQVTITYKIYTTIDIQNYAIKETPAFTGFWAEDISPKRPGTNTEAFGEKLYRTLLLKRVALFPQQTGELEIENLAINAVLRKPIANSRSILRRYRTEKKNLVSNSKKILVKALPNAGKPDNFTGLVGKYSISSRLSPPQIKQGEQSSYRVEISGSGNVKLIEEPNFEIAEGLTKYDPIVEENSYPNGTLIKGRKSFEYAIVPEREGKFPLGNIELSYFDPQIEKYIPLKTRTSRLIVLRGENIEAYNSPDVRLGLRNSLMGQLNLHSAAGSYFFASIPFCLFMALPFFIFPAFWWTNRKKELEEADVVGRRRREAVLMAQNRLSQAQTHLEKREKKPFYDEVIRTIWGYLSDKLQISTSELSKDNIATILKENEVGEPTSKKLLDTLQYCEMALFAPVPDADNLEGTYQNTIDLIAELEEALD